MSGRIRAGVETALARIAATQPALQAFQHVAADRALARADALDRADAPEGPLHGLPLALKDNIVARGIPTTAGSKILEGYQAPYDAAVVERLEAAGAVIVGTTRCDEFAMGSSTDNCAYGPAHNPWDLTRTPGGSSGGSAAAVAASLVPIALGSDTGGSIRQPASLCGVVGVKPTYGRVSRYGLMAFASSLDQIGPLTRTTREAAAVLEVISGHDARDSTSAQQPVPAFVAALTGDVRNVRIGVPRHLITNDVDEDVRAAFEAALAVAQSLGAEVRDVELPNADRGIAVYYLIATAEASANLARYDGVRYGHRAAGATSLPDLYERSRHDGFGAEVKRRIMLGTYVLSAGYYDAYYLKAQQVRTLIARDFARAFETVDVVALPTSPCAAFRLGERVDNPLQMYLADVYTVGANLAGLPGISVPCGFTTEGLPIGLQFIARPWDEATMLRTADAYEQATAWGERVPVAMAK
ncbi:MAG: Asp-tRNA(Asn)/Glu-tRNA(Gln) amidotransferase subunit GatA [Acidobacteria bacterium]|nr:Asp-tRNA(Asn)/Glu-tRNA(Gln) amidotransferase subunit GatA [Acidobacteriota bacterium]